MYNFIKHYKNPEQFNEEFIYMKKTDDPLKYVDYICKALEVVEGIHYLGSTINTDESTFRTRGSGDKKWIPIDESRLNLITIKFKIEGKDGRGKQEKSEIIEKNLYFPKLVDDFFFILNGSRYFPIFQIIDGSTYHTPKSLTLKTLLMPVVIRHNVSKFEDTKGKEYNARVYLVDLFRHKVNILNYFFAHMGFNSAIEYFGLGDKIEAIPSSDELQEEGYVYFRVNNHIILKADEETVATKFGIDMIATIMDTLTSRAKWEDIQLQDYWKKRLGAIFTKNTSSQVEKAEKILISFQRVLDEGTKNVLRLEEHNKDSTFAIIRWKIRNYDALLKRDNMDLRNKRIRVMEYIFYPLLLRFSTSTYRLLNSKTVTLAKKRSIFNTLSPGFLIKAITQNELLRYYNAVNAIDLFTANLKYTFRGPQSLTEGGKDNSVNIRYRGLHPSYVGRVGLTTSSSGDPGLSGTFTPFIQTDGFYFDSRMIDVVEG